MSLTDHQHTALTGLIRRCAKAVYDDRGWNVWYEDAGGKVHGHGGVNSYEASTVLEAVAEILGIPGPGSFDDAALEALEEE